MSIKMNEINLFAVILSAVLLSVQLTNIGVYAQDIPSTQPLGRLLTPQEGCGISKAANTKIVGGTQAKPGAFPWIAMIVKTKEKGDIITKFSDCGGSLITSRHVLTAAHCIKPEVSFVRLGEHDVTTTTDGEHQDIPVIASVKHPKYNSLDSTHDIGIITLERDVPFTDRIRPVCLPLDLEMQKEYFVGTNPFVAGWGLLKENGKKPDVLMQVQLPVLDNEVCEEKYESKGALYSRNQFTRLVICAGNLAGGKDACAGDSGGPLMLPIQENGSFPMYQIGVVAYGMGCARPNAPGVYTRVSYYVDWIKKQLN